MKSELIKKNHSFYKETADIETSSEDYARRFYGKIGEYFLDVQAVLTLDLLKSFPKASVLDVGGGHVQLAVPLINNGFKITIVGSADVCRKRLDKLLKPYSFEYYTCNLLELPFENNKFDVVLAYRLLPHTSHWERLISEMCRIAKKCVIIDYPDARSFNIMYKLMFRAKRALEGDTRSFCLFTRKQLVREFSKHQFGQPVFKPEFFIPMVIHRELKSMPISRLLECISHKLGLTSLFGSPIILRIISKLEQQN